MQVLPFVWQSLLHDQPPGSHTQLDEWQVLGSGSGVHVQPSGQLFWPQLTGLGAPLHRVAAGM